MRFVWLEAAHGDREIPVNPEQICYLMDGGEHTLVVFSAATGGTGLHSLRIKGTPREVAERIEAQTQNRAIFRDFGDKIRSLEDGPVWMMGEGEGKSPFPDLGAIDRAGAAMTRAQEILGELASGADTAGDQEPPAEPPCPLCRPGQDCEHTQAERDAVARDQAADKPPTPAAPTPETTAAPGATGTLGRGRGKR